MSTPQPSNKRHAHDDDTHRQSVTTSRFSSMSRNTPPSRSIDYIDDWNRRTDVRVLDRHHSREDLLAANGIPNDHPDAGVHQ